MPTLRHFTNYVEEHAYSKSLGFNHPILVKFMNRYPRLKVGGELLPSLIEFYVWIHTDLNHVITKKEATDTSILEVVEQAAAKYSKDIERHYKKLFEKVQGAVSLYSKTSYIFSFLLFPFRGLQFLC